jgi:hypothetical protein
MIDRPAICQQLDLLIRASNALEPKRFHQSDPRAHRSTRMACTPLITRSRPSTSISTSSGESSDRSSAGGLPALRLRQLWWQGLHEGNGDRVSSYLRRSWWAFWIAVRAALMRAISSWLSRFPRSGWYFLDPRGIRFATDSSLEGDGFEPSVFYPDSSVSAAFRASVAAYLHPYNALLCTPRSRSVAPRFNG